jgi:hypothetical protein
MVDTDVEFDIPNIKDGSMQEEEALSPIVEDDEFADHVDSMPQSSVHYTAATGSVNSRTVSRAGRSRSRSLKSSVAKSSITKGTPPKRASRNRLLRNTNGRQVRDIGSNESTPERAPAKKNRARSS